MKLKNLIAGVCALGGFALSAQAEMVSYWDPVGKVMKSADATVVTAGTETLTGGWYVVKGEVSRNRRINVDAAANLILADGASLTVVEPYNEYNDGGNPGIRVESGKTLNIYAQSTDPNTMGRLSATGAKYGAGIGGGDGAACGTVNIYGGNVTAIGANCGAGIGGGDNAAGGTITIFDGVVAASCAGDSGAGIGGGGGKDRGGAGGVITISGGTVTATGGAGSHGGAGIGGGGLHAGGEITISGGRVTAAGGGNGAGIGGGGGGAGGSVTISGGTVVAKSGNKLVWDIGAGMGGKPDFDEFVVKGGSVLLANSGLCRDGYPKNAVGGVQVHRALIPGFEANAAVKIEGVPNYGTNDIFADASGNVYLYLPNGSYDAFTVNGVPCPVTIVNGQVKVFASTHYWDPVAGVSKSEDAAVVTIDTTTLEDGWYVVKGEVLRSLITVSGTANLILADGANLTVSEGGIIVGADATINIYAQSADARTVGRLSATGGEGAAGIGGSGAGGSCGTVNIYGGLVTAIGGKAAAGIGGGKGVAGGKISILGGFVRAKGIGGGAAIGGGSGAGGGTIAISGGEVHALNGLGHCGAGIGGGDQGAGGTITISGGWVSAMGGVKKGKNDAVASGAAGIGGGGDYGAGGVITISGGTVTAVGGRYGAGIGGGGRTGESGGSGGVISISGGKVVATGVDGGAAIGGGNRAEGGTITISGGEVIADNSEYGDGAGIGGGYSAAGGEITISGGRVTAVGGANNNGAAGIGGGSGGAGGKVTIVGGTVVAKSGNKLVWDIGAGMGGKPDSDEFIVTGGSIFLANSGKCRDGYPKSSEGGTSLALVAIEGLPSDDRVVLGSGFGSYGGNDLYPIGGRLYFYLPGGSYDATMRQGNSTYSVSVKGGGATVEPIGTDIVQPGGEGAIDPDGVDIGYILSQTPPEWRSGHVRDFPSDFKPGDKLTTGIYVVTNNITVDASGLPGTSAIVVPHGNVVVLYVAKGATLTVKGGDALGGKGAGAGIEVPFGAKLTVVGGGTIDATGGNAASGADAEDGGEGKMWFLAEAVAVTGDIAGEIAAEPGPATATADEMEATLPCALPGDGGAGGDGGGGAAAAIGGRGGDGGAGGVRHVATPCIPERLYWRDKIYYDSQLKALGWCDPLGGPPKKLYTYDPNDISYKNGNLKRRFDGEAGSAAGAGADGQGCGEIVISQEVDLIASRGEAASGVGANGQYNKTYTLTIDQDYRPPAIVIFAKIFRALFKAVRFAVMTVVTGGANIEVRVAVGIARVVVHEVKGVVLPEELYPHELIYIYGGNGGLGGQPGQAPLADIGGGGAGGAGGAGGGSGLFVIGEDNGKDEKHRELGWVESMSDEELADSTCTVHGLTGAEADDGSEGSCYSILTSTNAVVGDVTLAKPHNTFEGGIFKMVTFLPGTFGGEPVQGVSKTEYCTVGTLMRQAPIMSEASPPYFTGYYTERECGGVRYFDRFRYPSGLPQIVGNLTLYAGWSAENPDQRITNVTVVTSNSLARGTLLSSGRVYHFTQDVELDGNWGDSRDSVSGLSLAPGTTVFYIDRGVTVHCTGRDGITTTPGGAGVEVQPGSTLIVTGEGSLIATGGKAGNGGNGGRGDDGCRANLLGNDNDWESYAGRGGDGGDGGGGAGAGIGGCGGYGLLGGAGGIAGLHYDDGDHQDGHPGESGSVGRSGYSCGTVYLLGFSTVAANSGAAGANGVGGEGGEWCYEEHGTLSKSFGVGGGGGGGSGGGGCVAADIGGGGGSGGSGGGGGSGSSDYSLDNGKITDYNWSGLGGRGGMGAAGPAPEGTKGTSSGNESRGVLPGDGGNGGTNGVTGANGLLYCGLGAYNRCNVTKSNPAGSRMEDFKLAYGHEVLERTIHFLYDGQEIGSVSAQLGEALPFLSPATFRNMPAQFEIAGAYRMAGGRPDYWYGPSGVRVKACYDYVSEENGGDVYLQLEIRRLGTVAIRNPYDEEKRKEYDTFKEAVDEVRYGEMIAVVGDVTQEDVKVPSGTVILKMPRGEFREPSAGDLLRDYHMVVQLGDLGGQVAASYFYTLDPDKVAVRFEPVDESGSAVLLEQDEDGANVAATFRATNFKSDLYYMFDQTDSLTNEWTLGEKEGPGFPETLVDTVGLVGDGSAQFFRIRVTDCPPEAEGSLVEKMFEYEVRVDGKVKITGLSPIVLLTSETGKELAGDLAGLLDIPETLGGRVVAEIAENAFAEIHGIVEVSLPPTVQKICEAAFRNCADLKSLNLRDGLKKIAESAFENCELLETLGIPGSVLEIGKAAFKGCKKIKSLTLMDGLEMIAKSAFEDCELLENIKLPSTLVEIGDFAFDGTRIVELILPKRLKRLGRILRMRFLKVLRFLGNECEHSAEESELPDDCVIYGPSEGEGGGIEPVPGPGGIVIIPWSDYVTVTNDDGTVLITGCRDVPSDGTLTVPAFIDGCPVVGIAANATFSGRAPLTAMTLPASVDRLGANAFANATALVSLTFEGDAPQTDGDVGLNGEMCTVYAQTDAIGWTNPWQGCKVVQFVRYRDPASKSIQVRKGCLTLTPDMKTLENGKWYVVQDNVTTTDLAVNGTANLILFDGVTLTANGTSGCAGITVADGNALTVWGQGGGMGALVATGGFGGAGIGGGANATNGTVTINGGQVTAQGGAGGPGIGGGKLGAGGTVKVNGGTVVAKAAGTGTWDVGSGWGGGEDVGEFVVSGGGVHLANSGKCREGYPQNAAEEQVYCVTVEGLEGLVSLENLDGYGTGDIFADADGKIYLWLPNGIYSFKANGTSYTATVANGPTTAVEQ